MAHTSTSQTLLPRLIETAMPALLLPLGFLAVTAVLILFGAPAHATEPATSSYIVTADEQTAVDLALPYGDNLDYELDNLRTDPDAELGCDALTMTATDGYVYAWYECVVPAGQERTDTIPAP